MKDLCSQQRSMIQDSEILLSEFFFEWTKLLYVLILIFLPSVVHDIQIESLWFNFEMTKLQQQTWISRFRKNSFINKYFTWKRLLLLIAIFLSPLVHEIQVWVLLTQFWMNDVTARVKNCNILRKWSYKQTPHSKFHQILILIFLSPSVHDIQLYFEPVLSNFEIMMSQKK